MTKPLTLITCTFFSVTVILSACASARPEPMPMFARPNSYELAPLPDTFTSHQYALPAQSAFSPSQFGAERGFLNPQHTPEQIIDGGYAPFRENHEHAPHDRRYYHLAPPHELAAASSNYHAAPTSPSAAYNLQDSGATPRGYSSVNLPFYSSYNDHPDRFGVPFDDRMEIAPYLPHLNHGQSSVFLHEQDVPHYQSNYGHHSDQTLPQEIVPQVDTASTNSMEGVVSDQRDHHTNNNYNLLSQHQRNRQHFVPITSSMTASSSTSVPADVQKYFENQAREYVYAVNSVFPSAPPGIEQYRLLNKEQQDVLIEQIFRNSPYTKKYIIEKISERLTEGYARLLLSYNADAIDEASGALFPRDFKRGTPGNTWMSGLHRWQRHAVIQRVAKATYIDAERLRNAFSTRKFSAEMVLDLLYSPSLEDCRNLAQKWKLTKEKKKGDRLSWQKGLSTFQKTSLIQRMWMSKMCPAAGCLILLNERDTPEGYGMDMLQASEGDFMRVMIALEGKGTLPSLQQ
jgi:hypothetical protein